jgi:hypothetical protein
MLTEASLHKQTLKSSKVARECNRYYFVSSKSILNVELLSQITTEIKV